MELTDAATDALAAQHLDDNSYDELFTDDVDVFKPDGSLLCRLRQNVLTEEECVAAFPVWNEAARTSYNRGNAGGQIKEDKRYAGTVPISKTRAIYKKHDGTVAHTRVANAVQSGIVGYFNRTARNPYCRLTSYNLDHPTRFASVVPFIRKIDAKFAELVPERYAAQKRFVDRHSQDFFIRGTAFSTITVNRNFQTAVHKDVGDLKQGFGVMTCLRRGSFTGCYFVFPKYRIALDMRTGCVLCADVHEWHGNSPMKGNKGMFERVSLVLYYREQMKKCGSAQEELERSKQLPRSGTSAALWDQLEADRAQRVAWEHEQAEKMREQAIPD